MGVKMTMQLTVNMTLYCHNDSGGQHGIFS